MAVNQYNIFWDPLLHKTPLCYVTHSWHKPLVGFLFI